MGHGRKIVGSSMGCDHKSLAGIRIAVFNEQDQRRNADESSPTMPSHELSKKRTQGPCSKGPEWGALGKTLVSQDFEL